MSDDDLQLVRALQGPWLKGLGAERFRARWDSLRARFDRETGPVLVTESDPIEFLAAFFAAMVTKRPVAVGNPRWGTREWQQALEAIRPVTICGAKESGAGPAGPDSTFAPGEILIPTGGTSGNLRFARHSWETLSAAAAGFGAFFGGVPVRSLCVLPLFHVSGLMQAVRAIVTGGELYLFDWRALEASESPPPPADLFLSLVPTQLRRLLEVEALHPWLTRLRAILIGGAACPPPVLEKAARLGLPLVLSYGATETGAMATAQRPEEFQAGARTSGRALPHVCISVVDTDGREVKGNREGRVRVEGASLFFGYVPGVASNANEWVPGDLGRIDEEGRLTILGREDRLIITGGEKVSPEEVEQVLQATGRFEEVAVFSAGDPEWGEVVVATYVSRREISTAEIRTMIRAQLAPHKMPKKWVRLEEIPKLANGKVDFRALSRRVASLD